MLCDSGPTSSHMAFFICSNSGHQVATGPGDKTHAGTARPSQALAQAGSCPSVTPLLTAGPRFNVTSLLQLESRCQARLLPCTEQVLF